MLPVDSQYERVLNALREKTFSDLTIRRVGSECYLIVTAGGKSHVFADYAGKRKVYRHAWQIRDWLQSTFGIPGDSVPVTTDV